LAIKKKQLDWLFDSLRLIKSKPEQKPATKVELQKALVPSTTPPPPVSHGRGKGLMGLHPSVAGKAPRTQATTKRKAKEEEDVFIEEGLGPVPKKTKRTIPKKKGFTFSRLDTFFV
jgi:hypothetical protein